MSTCRIEWLTRGRGSLPRRSGCPPATSASAPPAAFPRPRGFGRWSCIRSRHGRSLLRLRRSRGGRRRSQFRIILLGFQSSGRDGDPVGPIGPAGRRLALCRQLDPVEHPLHKLGEKLSGRFVRNHGDPRIGLETVAHLGPILDARERARPGERPKGPSNLFELHGVGRPEGDSENRLNREADEVAGQGDHVRASTLLDRFRQHPKRRTISGKIFRAADVGENPVGGRANNPPRLDRDGRGRGGYRDSSSRTRRAPSTMEVSFATVSSIVRVLSPQSGVT